MIKKTCEITGAEIPKKCCENCTWRKRGYHIGALSTNFRFCYGATAGGEWDYSEDYCSRFEFKKDEEKSED